MASIIKINLDTSKENYILAKCKQNDDLTLEASIFENGLEKDLTNCEIIIQALKADKTYIIQNTNITKENNKIIADLDRDFTRAAGKTEIEIVLVESGKQNTTFNFYLEVVASVIRGAVESSNTVTILEELGNKIVEAGQVKEETEHLIATGGAATKGDIEQVNSQLEHMEQQKAEKTETSNLQSQINAIVLEGTSGDSSAEVAQARIDKQGHTFSTVKEHFDNTESSIEKYIDKKYKYDWIIGGVDGDGSVSSSGTFLKRIVTNTIIYTTVDLTVGLKDYSTYWYAITTYTNPNDEATYNTTGRLDADNIIKAGTYFRLQVGTVADVNNVVNVFGDLFHTLIVKFDGSLESIVDITNEFVKISTDLEGNNFDSPSNRINNVEYMVRTGFSKLTVNGYEIGSITADGLIGTNRKRIRTIDYHNIAADMLNVIVDSGYRIYICFYNYDSNASTYNFVSNTGWITGEKSIAVTGTHFKVQISTDPEVGGGLLEFSDHVIFETKVTTYDDKELIKLLKDLPGDYNFIGTTNDVSKIDTSKYLFNDVYAEKNEETSEYELYTCNGDNFVSYKNSGEKYGIEKTYDVCIVGGGTGGVASAYAFINKGYKVLLIEKHSRLGGTATVAGVDSWIEGLNTPVVESVFTELLASGKAIGTYDNSWLPEKFADANSTKLKMDGGALSTKYYLDLTNGGIEVALNSEFINYYECIDGKIKSIVYRNADGQYIKANANVFIDSTTDASLIRGINNLRDVDYFYGRDYKSKYNESLAIETGDKNYLNEPTLHLKLVTGGDDSHILNAITTVYKDVDGTIIYPSYLKKTGYKSLSIDGTHYIANTMRGSGIQGWNRLKYGVDKDLTDLKKRTLEFWKFAKLTCEQDPTGWAKWATSDLSFAGYLEMVGIRETYRVNCDKILTQNDLSILVSDEIDVIAEGSHIVDFHVIDGMNTTAIANFNATQLKPYGIKYGSIVPQKLKNCFVASKCYGASQIALASARVNKVINQLGWTAGNASLIYLEDKLDDVRDVDLIKLKSDNYTEFSSRLAILLEKYNSYLV